MISMSLPFYLTFIRVVMSPVFMLLYLYGGRWGIGPIALPYVLLGVVALCELSDIFDGFLARKHNKVTDLGKVLDPMADSIFRLSVFLSFTQGVIQIPLIMVLIFLLRESIVTSLRTLCALQGVALGARFSGKVKAVVQAVAAFFILILMIPYSMGCLALDSFQQMSFYAAGIAALYTLVSGCEYIAANWKLIKRAFA
jgi:CDP-diacylglycerol---glycerol-3-phosphate 3-phosphatidyltransferase